jgi:CubicO group peptidase (beta-lactamase class C family)
VSALDLLQRWPVPPRAAGVLAIAEPATVDSAAEHAPAPRIEVVETFGDLDEVCYWASVTKLLVALAVLVEAENQSLALADPCGPPGSTVRHLLAHASGLGPDLPEPLSPPGVRRIYSNIGFELLGEFVSVRCARSWPQVVADVVTGPIGMQRTGVVAGGSAASGATGSVSDLLALGRELLSPTVISRAGLDSATRVAFPGLSGVVPGIGRFENCDWGLGFEIKGSKQPHWTATSSSPRTFGHFGRSGAFLWVDPDAGVACAIAGGAPFGPWALEKWPELSDAVIASWAAPGFRSGVEPGIGET